MSHHESEFRLNKYRHRKLHQPQKTMTTSHNFQNQFAEERLRQARQTFNLAIGCISLCVITSVGGIGLVYGGKTTVGIVTGIAGVLPISRCIKFYREANDRLDELMNEPIVNDEETAPT